MAHKPNDNSENYTALARFFAWFENRANQGRLFWELAVICVLLLVFDLFWDMHGYFDMEAINGFYAVFGFVAFSCVIMGAKFLRLIIKRNEDYYAPKSVDNEDYPDVGTQKVDHDA